MIPVIIFTASLFVYVVTLAPTISFFDSGEMIAGAYTLGVAHPPGYPVYVTLGKLFTFIPLNNVAYRVNLMSAFFAALTSVMIYYITRATLDDGEDSWGLSLPLPGMKRVGIPEIAGFFSAMAFALSYNLWAWAVVSKFYTLNAFVVSCILMLLIRWRRARRDEGDAGGGHSMAYIYVLAFLCGIAGVVHISQFVLLPMYMLYILLVDWRVFLDYRHEKGAGALRAVLGTLRGIHFKLLFMMLFFFMLGHSIYMHLPLRASQEPLINWGSATTWRQFLWDYNREGYGVIGGTRSWGLFWEQAKSFNLVREFTWAGIPLILGGLWGHYRKDWRHFTVLVFGSILMTFSIIVLGNPPIENIFLLEQFYIPVYIFLTVIMGGGVYLILKKRPAGPFIMGTSLPFLFLGEAPMGYLKDAFTGSSETVEGTSFLGAPYPPYLYFLFYLAMAALFIFTARMLIKSSRPAFPYLYVSVFAVIFMLYPAYQLKAHYWKNDRSNNYIGYDMGNAELTFAREFSVLFTWGDSGAFPMWYLQDVEQKRPDVLLIHTPHLPLDWFIQTIKRDAARLGDRAEIAGNYGNLRNYNGLKYVDQLLDTPDEFRDPAIMIKDIVASNPERTFSFDYSSRYSIDMPYDAFPYGLTYLKFDKNSYVQDNSRIWSFLITRGLPEPTISLDLDESKAVEIYGYIHADTGNKFRDMGLMPLARREFALAVKYTPELWEQLGPFVPQNP